MSYKLYRTLHPPQAKGVSNNKDLIPEVKVQFILHTQQYATEAPSTMQFN